jgi:hypothetical protein
MSAIGVRWQTLECGLATVSTILLDRERDDLIKVFSVPGQVENESQVTH